MELAQIVNAYEALSKIKSSNELPFSLAWKFSDITDILEKHYQRYEKERSKIVMEFGEANGDGSYRVSPDNLEPFQKSMEKLLLHKVELEITKQIELIDLLDSKIVIDKEVNISALKPFISNKTAIEVIQTKQS